MTARHTASPLTPGQRLPMSYEEFLVNVGEEVQAEWVDGEVTIFMPPSFKHQQVTGLLLTLLDLFVDLFELGVVCVAPFEMRAWPDGPAREPDLLFVAREHLDRLTPTRLAGPADLVVEVISTESVARDRADKFYEYQQAGIPEYWIIDPRPGLERSDFFQRTAEGIYQAVLPDAAGWYHAAVLPGFRLKPAWLKQEPLPKPLTLLREIAPHALHEALQGGQESSGD